uniref:Kelch-like protein 2 n=1 Tax=Ciona intestinalis TaxID=7719 RepID=F6WWQ0_CIOIN|nr:kelch-like protein 2 isoform X2 [Ciona intestinalis]|eukprot:XP_018668811.1 kelch-like protein 2 isoform X2 [Ciona intestinalis]
MVLSCFSEYFQKLFTTEMKEKYKDCVEVNGVDVKSMTNLVEFMYTGEISINMDNVCYLLAVSDYLQMQFKELCIQYLMDATSPQNCFTIQVLADRFNIPVLSENNKKFIILNYKQVVSNDQFKRQSKEVATLFLQETHNQVSPDLVYTAVMNWVKFDLASNEKYLNELTQFVNFHELSPQILGDAVSVEPLLRKSDDNVDKTLKVFSYHMKNITSPGKSLICLGGARTLNKVMKYDLRRNEWSELPDLPVGRQLASAVVVDNVLYFIAGYLPTAGGNVKPTNIVHRMDLNKNFLQWEKVASVIEERYAAGATVLNGSIFLFGGISINNCRLSSGECFVTSLNKWIKVANMKTEEYFIVLVTLEDRIYLLGGVGTPSVACYDPTLSTWGNVAPMQTARKNLAAVVLNKAIYALGGKGAHEQVLKSVEKFNADNNTWVYVADMNIGRSHHTACVAQNKIYVVGGVNFTNKAVKSVECYDPQTNKWSIVCETEVAFFNHSLVAI